MQELSKSEKLELEDMKEIHHNLLGSAAVILWDENHCADDPTDPFVWTASRLYALLSKPFYENKT